MNTKQLAIAKGFSHALLMPVFVALAAYLIQPNTTIVAGAGYLLFATVIYTLKYRKNPEDKAAGYFFNFANVWVFLLSLFLMSLAASIEV